MPEVNPSTWEAALPPGLPVRLLGAEVDDDGFVVR
jgi:hypothetical protein